MIGRNHDLLGSSSFQQNTGPSPSQKSFMKHQISGHQERCKLPLKLMGQIILVAGMFFLLSRLITSLSFAGKNGVDLRATAGVSSEEIFDGFGFKVFDGKWNDATWAEAGTGSKFNQLDGVLTVSRDVVGSGGLIACRRKWLVSQIDYVKSIVMLNSDIQTQEGNIGVEINAPMNGNERFVKCAIHGGQGKKTAVILCDTADQFSTTPIEVSYDTWHVVHFDIDAEKPAITFWVDGNIVDTYIPKDASGFKVAEYSLVLMGESSSAGLMSGSFDAVELKTR